MMCRYKIEPKRIQFVHPYVDKEPTMVLIEGMKGGKSRVTIEPPVVMYRTIAEKGSSDGISRS